jgi:hypothetical protein
LAEALWGTVKGWFAGMRLYVDVLPVNRDAVTGRDDDREGKTAEQGHMLNQSHRDEDVTGIDHRYVLVFFSPSSAFCKLIFRSKQNPVRKMKALSSISTKKSVTTTMMMIPTHPQRRRKISLER